MPLAPHWAPGALLALRCWFDDHPLTLPGRVVFGGNNVRDEYGLAATFPEAGPGASYGAASKLLDAVSALPGNDGQQSDAPAAYIQSEMYEDDIENDEIETFVQLLEWQWTPVMKAAYAASGRRPVCKTTTISVCHFTSPRTMS